MSLKIIEAGVLDTVQDHGRFGYGALGINTGGVMDSIATSVANYLVGNDKKEAVLELHFPVATIQFTQPALISITGADFTAHINELPAPINTAIHVPAESILRFTKHKTGARTYLAVKEGFNIPEWLNSYSTNLKAKAGGLAGRALCKGDEIQFKHQLQIANELRIFPWHADVAQLYTPGNEIKCIKGNEYNLLTDCSVTILDGNTFTISSQSDRMGFRMNGSPLQLNEQKQMISSAVTKGTVQLLPNGQIIILMADHQTTGGYPEIAHVISADIAKLAQMPINTALRFKLVAIEDAEAALLKQHHHLQQLKNACTFRLQEYLQQHAIN